MTLVARTVSEIRGNTLEQITPSSSLLEDLGLDGDDFSMWLVPEIEWQFQFRGSTSEWEQVRTVLDVVDMVDRHRRIKSPNPSAA